MTNLPKKKPTTPKKLVQAWCDEKQVKDLYAANVNIPELVRIAIREAHARLKKEAL